MTSSARLRTTALTVLLASLALVMSGCGGNDADAADKPSASTSTTASETPTPTPTPTPTAEPLSAFEGKAPVKAARAWAVAEARAVNTGERSMASLAPVATAQGIGVTKKFAADDIAHGYQLPGPHPFTPVNIQVRAGLAKLNTCFMNKGWSTDPATGKPVRKRNVIAVVMEIRKVSGVWKFDTFYTGTGDCAGVMVKGVRW